MALSNKDQNGRENSEKQAVPPAILFLLSALEGKR